MSYGSAKASKLSIFLSSSRVFGMLGSMSGMRAKSLYRIVKSVLWSRVSISYSISKRFVVGRFEGFGVGYGFHRDATEGEVPSLHVPFSCCPGTGIVDERAVAS